MSEEQQMNGTWTTHWSNGTICNVITYKNNKYNGWSVTFCNEEQDLLSNGFFRDDVRVGLFYQYVFK